MYCIGLGGLFFSENPVFFFMPYVNWIVIYSVCVRAPDIWNPHTGVVIRFRGLEECLWGCYFSAGVVKYLGARKETPLFSNPIQRTLDASMESPLLVRARALLSDSNLVDGVNVIIAVIIATCMSMTRHVQTELNDVVDGAPRDGSITSSMQCVLTST